MKGIPRGVITLSCKNYIRKTCSARKVLKGKFGFGFKLFLRMQIMTAGEIVRLLPRLFLWKYSYLEDSAKGSLSNISNVNDVIPGIFESFELWIQFDVSAVISYV